MRLLLWFTLIVVICAHIAQGGIFRRYSRRPRQRPVSNARIGPPGARSIGRQRAWPSLFFRRQRSPWIINRNARRFTVQTKRQDNRHQHYLRQPSMLHHVILPMMPQLPSSTLSSWRPLDYGNPIDRDPTFDYAPPAIERVRFSNEGRSRGGHRRPPPPVTASARNEHGKPRPPVWKHRRPTRPSLWKMLASKQRPSFFRRPLRPRHPMPPQPPRYHHRFPHEAEVFPHIPNIVYFQPTDVMSSPPTIPGPMMIIPNNYKHGTVINTPLYSHEVSAGNEFKPIKLTENRFNIVGYSGPPSTTTRKPPTVLQPVKTTPVTISTTHNSVVKPFLPTDPTTEISQEEVDVDGLLENPPAPIPVVPNSFNILDTDYEGNDIDAAITQIETKGKEIRKHQPIFESKRVPTSPVANKKPEKVVLVFSTTPRVSVATSKSVSMSVGESSREVQSGGSRGSATSKERMTVPTSTRRSAGPRHSTTTTTTTTTSTTTPTTTTTTTTPEPPTSASTTTTTTTTEKPSSSSTIFPKLPTMPTYKRRPTPIYARKQVHSTKLSGNSVSHSHSGSGTGAAANGVSSKESQGGGGSGEKEIVVITANRSKVKEYKPQLIANHTQLIAFDKVADIDSLGGETEAIEVVSPNLPSPSSTTTNSPLQEFDPMQLLHSWFTKP